MHPAIMDNYKNTLQEMCQKNRYGMPTYNLEDEGGTPNNPSFTVSVTVRWDGETLVERVTAVGKKKKEVEKMAARKMVERISSGASTSASFTAVTPPTRRAVDTRKLSPVPDIYGRPVTSPSSSIKNELQELLQRSIFNYPPPLYDHFPPQGPSHKRKFTCKCVVKNNHDLVIHQTQGSASTKKEAEMNAAKEMLPFIKAMLEDGGQLVPQGTPRTYRRTPPAEIIDPDLDSDLVGSLSVYTPHFELREGIDSKWLCLAIALSGCREGEPAVASHGVGDSESAAKREAQLNLIHNLQELGYVI